MKFPLVVIVSIATIFATQAPARADIFSAFESPGLFGNLNQHDTYCDNVACGPTAAVNSFVYLQNRYKNLYDGRLIPHVNGNTPYQDMVDVADTLGTSAYMYSCDLCNPDKNGTYIEEFIGGKARYLNAVAPGTTSIVAMDTLAWRPVTPDGYDNGPKPAYVTDNTAPTLAFLYDQIKMGEDVELFINFNGGNHYVTLTGISYNDMTNTGYLDFIDPEGGVVMDDIDITGLDPADNDILLGGYLPGANIVNAVAESPIPEPAALALMVTGLLGIAVLRRRP